MTSAPAKRADMIVHEQEPYNAEPPRAALAEHVITPVEVFYGRNHGTMPEIDAGAWRLRVGGMVGHALEFSLTELQQRFAPVEVTATLQCAGNRRAGLMAFRDIPGQHPWGAGATSTARWRGARLTDVLTACGLDPHATDIAFDAPTSPRKPNHHSPSGDRSPRTRPPHRRSCWPGR